MIKVTIYSSDTRNQSGNSKATGKPYSMNFQEAWFHTVDKNGNAAPHPIKSEIMLEKDSSGNTLPPYAVGQYSLHPSSVYTDPRTGHIAFSPRLVALKPTAA